MAILDPLLCCTVDKWVWSSHSIGVGTGAVVGNLAVTEAVLTLPCLAGKLVYTCFSYSIQASHIMWLPWELWRQLACISSLEKSKSFVVVIIAVMSNYMRENLNSSLWQALS